MKSFRNNSPLLLTICGILALSCYRDSRPLDVQEAGAGGVQLHVAWPDIPNGVQSLRFLLGGEGPTLMERVVVLTAESDTFDVKIDSVPAGTWNLTVIAEDQNGSPRLTTTSAAIVEPSEVASAEVYMCPIDGAGSVEMLILWQNTPSHGREFDLRFGESVQVGGTDITITFADVTEDSRCPYSVVCVWGGNARVLLVARGDTVALNSALEPHEAFVGAYRLRMILLRPYPRTARSITKSDYVVRLRLSN